jgi:hypothetical protein
MSSFDRLNEALSFHDMTREKMVNEGIQWLESVQLESPSLYRFLIADPPEMVDKIKQWDFTFSTGISTDYPKRRNWTGWMALREFVQNALDVEDKKFGYQNIRIRVFQDQLGIHVIDAGPGVTIEGFKMGGSEKGCHERGFFGEGMKIAAAYFVSAGTFVYVFNRQGQVFKVCVPPGTDLIRVVLGRANPSYSVLGTEVIIYRATMEPDLMERMVWQEWMKKHPNATIISKSVRSSRNCPTERPNFIIEIPNEFVDALWVRDIYVNKLSAIERIPAMFGYNLWWVSLEPNRNSVASIPELQNEIAQSFDKTSIKHLLSRLEEKRIGYSVINPDVLEAQIEWDAVTEDTCEGAKEWTESNNYAVTNDKRIIDWAIYMGVKPLVYPYAMRKVFSKCDLVEHHIIRQSVERLMAANKTTIPEEELNLGERCILGVCKNILQYIFWRNNIEMPNIAICNDLKDAAGLKHEKVLFARRTALSSIEEAYNVLGHEAAHYYGNIVYGNARDISHAFEAALSDMLGFTAKALLNTDIQRVTERCMNGGWNARFLNPITKEWKHLSTDFYELVRKTLTKDNIFVSFSAFTSSAFEMVERECFSVITITHEDKTLTPYGIKFYGRINSIIPFDMVPIREIYDKKVNNTIANIKSDMTPLERERTYVFIYDPWIDQYVFWGKMG